jgi:glycerol-3-phosphate dehydrogenase (NAD(P)+)
VAIMLARAGVDVVLITRTAEQAETLRREGVNQRYLPGISLPRELEVEHGWALDDVDGVFLGVPSYGMADVVPALAERLDGSDAFVVSLAKGLMPPSGSTPGTVLAEAFGEARVGYVGGPAHASEMVASGARLVVASRNAALAGAVADALGRVTWCEASTDPVGIELAGVAKNIAALAAGAMEGHGLNVAGAAAGAVFAEVWRYAESLGAAPASFIGTAGAGDLVATTLAATSRNRRAGRLLYQGVSGAEIPERIGQAVEALESLPLLAGLLARAGTPEPTIELLHDVLRGRRTTADLAHFALGA